MLSLKTKITGAFALAVILTVLLLGGLSHLLLVQTLTEVQQQEMHQFARSTVKDLSQFLHHHEEIMARMDTRDYHSKRGDLPLAKHFSRFTEEFPVLIYLDRAGEEKLRLVRGSIALPMQNWSSHELFRKAMASPNQVVYSRAELCPDLGEPVVWMAVARFGYFGDEFFGILVGGIPLSAFSAVCSQESSGNCCDILIIDDNGQLLHHPEGPGLLHPLGGSAAAARQLLRQTPMEQGFARATLQGRDVFVAYEPLQPLGWSVVAQLPHEEFMAAPKRLRTLTLAICLSILAAGCLVSHLFSQRLTTAIDQLIAQTGHVAGGDFSRRVETGSGDELSRLAAAFNTMTETLQATTQARDSVDEILQSIIDPLIVADADGRLVKVNASAVRLFGHTEKELLGQTLSSLFGAGETVARQGELFRLLGLGPVSNLETRVITREGHAVPVLLSCSLCGSGSGQGPAGVVGIIKDITERKRVAEERSRALAEAEAARDRIDAMLRSVAEALVVTDLEQRLLLMNPAAEQLLGIGLEDALGRPLRTVIKVPGLRDHLLAALPGPQEQLKELEVFDHGRRENRILQATTAAVKNREGKKSGYITSLRDVTEERLVERLKNEFISTAAHELRTPLTSVMGYAELLLKPEDFGGFTREQQQEFLGEIYEKTEVLARIVGDLLDIARIESGQAVPLDRVECSLDRSIAKVVRHYQVHHPDHRLEVHLEAAEGHRVLADENKMVQVLENLVSNAVKYSPRGSRVAVTSRVVDAGYLILVEDEGIGMSADQVRRIFDKFYRVDASDTAVGGLGLGMSIVRNIVEAHDGTIEVDSTPGQGTRVRVILPLSASSSRIWESEAAAASRS
ncbi:ATP-binding protein [Desulfuromonas versatilis]|nr:ATP-binding protein [Desulfuromonas versatilis]